MKLRIRPLIIHCVGRNGLCINGNKLEVGEKRILRDGDIIGLTKTLRLFQLSYRIGLMPKMSSCEIYKKYFISDVIGRGGCGEVHLCYKISQNKTEETNAKFDLFALKIMAKNFNPMEQKNHDQCLKDLMSEVNVMKKLKDPHVLELIDYFQTPTSLLILVPFMHGGDLLHRIVENDQKRCTEADSKFFFLQILLGLDYMHSQVNRN